MEKTHIQCKILIEIQTKIVQYLLNEQKQLFSLKIIAFSTSSIAINIQGFLEDAVTL